MNTFRRQLSQAPLVVWAFIGLGVSAVCLAVVSLALGGIGWDSRNNVETALAFSEIYPNTALDDAYAIIPTTSEYYGTLVQQAADVLFVLRGGATETGSIGRLGPTDPWTYRYQGIVVILISVLAITTLATVLSLAFKSWLVGAFFWALTLSTPLWLGMSHVNFKDVPVASGLTMVSASLILAQINRKSPPSMRTPLLIGAVGASITLGTRPGAITLLLGLCAGTAVVAAIYGRSVAKSDESAIRVSLVATLSILGGGIFLWLTNPIARLSPKDWIIDTVATVSNYPWIGGIRTAGVDVASVDLPLWYVPAWLVAQLPVLTLLALALVGVGISWRLIRDSSSLVSAQIPMVAPLLIQGIILPLTIVIAGSVLYDGLRHLLFMVPALFALLSLSVFTLIRNVRQNTISYHVMMTFLVAVVGFSLLASLRWAPYSYAFINPIAGLWKDGWELDYWGVSSREGVVRLREMGYQRVRTIPWKDQGVPWGAEDSNEEIESREPTAAYVFWRSGVRAADLGCRPLFEVTRDGKLLGEGAECPPEKVHRETGN